MFKVKLSIEVKIPETGKTGSGPLRGSSEIPIVTTLQSKTLSLCLSDEIR
jgi:hypothetical protein